MTAAATTNAIAQELLARGLHPFPADHPDQPKCIGLHGPGTPCDGQRGKHPAVKFGTWAVEVTPQQIDLAWEKRGGLCNIAVACGPSSLVVLDEDAAGEVDRWCAANGITLPPTYVVDTGRGKHYYFAWDHSAQRIGNSDKAFDGYRINVRGDGGYVIAEGSLHATGVTYTGNGRPRFAPLPPELAEVLLAGAAQANGEAPGESFWEKADDPNSTMIPDGERHNALVAYAGRLRNSGLDRHEVEPAYRQRWLLCEQPEGLIPEATFHTPTCRHPVTWDEARGKLDDVFGRYRAGTGTGSGQVSQPRPRNEFWEATDELRTIRDFARARRANPWAMLGVVLARVVTTVRPTVQIPPYVGDVASLNLYVALVGPSGLGKGTAERAAAKAVKTASIYSTGPGSGEGINHLFAYYDKDTAKTNGGDGTKFLRHQVLFSVPEVSTLEGLDKRNGSTLLSQLCKAWSGEALTFGYVDRAKALVIPEHSYRLCMVVGVQPGKAGVLLDAADQGVPQRFLWLPALDPDMPDVKPDEPAPVDCERWVGYYPAMGKPPRLLDLPVAAAEQVDRNQVLKHRCQGDPALDGHLGLCRIKVAVALAVLHQAKEVTDEHWELAGVVMEVSQETRDGIEAGRRTEAIEKNRHRGEQEGQRAVVAENVRTTAAVKRVAAGIVRKLRKENGEAQRSVVYRSLRSTDRDYFDEALERLVAAGQVEEVSGGSVELLRLVTP